VKWDRLVRLAQKVPWVKLVVLAMLVLPVLLVILAYLDQLDPKAQQALRGLLQHWLPRLWLPPASGTETP
jgi:hypothetical protein